MNHKLIATHPTPGELAEQRHLVDPLDHKFEHLADERHPASTPTLSPQREAEIRDHVATIRNFSPGNLAALDLLAEVDRLRAELAALPAPVVETAWRDGLGNVWPLGHFPAQTEALVLKTNPTIQRTVRYGEWTEVTA